MRRLRTTAPAAADPGRRAACRAAGQPVALRTACGPWCDREGAAKEGAMQFVVFDDYRVGVLAPDGVRDVTSVVPNGDPAPPHILINRLIENYDKRKPVLEAAAEKPPPRPLADVPLRPPLPAPMNVYAAPA